MQMTRITQIYLVNIFAACAPQECGTSSKHLLQPLFPPRKRAMVIYLVIEVKTIIQEVRGLVQGPGIGYDGEQGGVHGHGKGTADTHLVVAVSYQRVTGLARHHVHHRGARLLQHPHQFVGVFVIGDAAEEVTPIREEQQVVFAIQHEVHHAVEAVLQFEDDFHVVLAEHQGVGDAEEEGGTGGGLDEGAHMEGLVIRG